MYSFQVPNVSNLGLSNVRLPAMPNVTMPKMPKIPKAVRLLGMTRFQNLMLIEALLFVIFSAIVSGFFIPSWLAATGDQYFFDSSVPTGFPSRQYGLIFVSGVRQQTWGELEGNACDRLTWYETYIGISSSAPMCESNLNNPQECTAAFSNHITTRCKYYSYMTLTTWITTGLMSYSALLVALCALTMLMVSLASWKRYILSLLVVASVSYIVACAVWYALLRVFFAKISETATYPTPGLSYGAFVGIGVSVLLPLVTIHFWNMSKIISLNNERFIAQVGLLDLAEKRLVDEMYMARYSQTSTLVSQGLKGATGSGQTVLDDDETSETSSEEDDEEDASAEQPMIPAQPVIVQPTIPAAGQTSKSSATTSKK